jgi:putative PIN family toxin of toxin-antitoxin system
VRVILDTNVFISAIFFGGVPYQALEAWYDGKIQLVVSQEILEEYRRVGEILSEQFPGVDVDPFLELVTVKADVVIAPSLPVSVCDDPDDDKFFACAFAGDAKFIVSGDKHLLRKSGYRGIQVVKPRKFIESYL